MDISHLIIIGIFLALSIVMYHFGIERGRKLEAFYQEYQKTIEKKDKILALQTGRNYFSHLRRGALKPSDENELKEVIDKLG